jgi:hypothetical protein
MHICKHLCMRLFLSNLFIFLIFIARKCLIANSNNTNKTKLTTKTKKKQRKRKRGVCQTIHILLHK